VRTRIYISVSPRADAVNHFKYARLDRDSRRVEIMLCQIVICISASSRQNALV
jgi:hypothetical protein